MKNIKDPYSERFGWYWYKPEMIFDFDEKEAEKDAQKFKESGITAVILFGTHFRFSFWAYWDKIVEAIGKFVKVFHSYGIKVIEHHSSHLTYQLPEKELEKLAASRQFPDFVKLSQANPVLGDTHLDDFAQIDGSTGKPALSSYIHTEGENTDRIFKNYSGNAHCFNNPHYIKAYKEHLKALIATGIDGMMNDDVQWFGGNNACACEYCRKKFKKETGYDLPYPDRWEEFFENFDDPAYVAWKAFKKKSSADFHFMLDEFYKSLGFDPIRPAYCAEVLPFDTTCYGFEGASELWDFIFQECCGVIRESFLSFGAEAVHRYALAKRRNVPSMAMMYPPTRDTAYLSFALSRSWGQLFTNGSASLPVEEVGYLRKFEKENAGFYAYPEKISNLAFYFSKKTRDLTDAEATRKYMKPLISALESSYVSGTECDMVFEEDGINKLKKHKTIMAVNVANVYDSEIEKLREYVKDGGTLIVCGPFGIKNGSKKRTFRDALKLLNIESKCAKRQANSRVIFDAEGKSIVFPKTFVHYIFISVSENAEIIAKTSDGAVSGIAEKYGKGRFVIFPCEIGNAPIQPAVWAGSAGSLVPTGSKIEEMREYGGEFISAFVKKDVKVQGDPDVIPTLFRTQSGYALHLVNIGNLISPKDGFISEKIPLENFDCGNKDRKLLKELRISVDIGSEEAKGISASSPEFEGDKELKAERNGNELVFTVPDDTFSGYLLCKIKI